MERDGHTVSGDNIRLSNEGRYVGESVCDEQPVCCEPEVTPNVERAREINIRPVDYGYVVQVGCQTFAIEDNELLIQILNEYLNNPQHIENVWMKSKVLPFIRKRDRENPINKTNI